MAIFEQELCTKLGITERERLRNAEISALFQNSVAACNVGTDFYFDDEAETRTNVTLMRAWDGAYKLVLDLIARGDFAVIIGLIEEEGKEYPCDPTPQSTRDAVIYVAKFFRTVYTVWLTELERNRIVPVAKFLNRVQEPVPPYYTNWIRSDYEEKAYHTALVTVESMLYALDETTFMGVCSFVKDPANIKDTQEARAVAWLCKKYEEAHRARLEEKKQALTLAGSIVNALGDM